MSLYIIAFTAGCASLWLIHDFPAMSWLAIIIALMAMTMVLSPAHLKWLFKGALAFCLGLSWVTFHHEWNAWYLKTDQVGQTLRVVGQIDQAPKYSKNHVHFTLTTQSINGQSTKQRLLLNWFHPKTIKKGETWRLNVRLKPPHGFANPGGFDFERWLFVNEIKARGYVRASPANQRLKKAHNDWLAHIRRQLANTIDQALAGYPLAGLIKALALGIKDDIQPDQWQLLMNSGTVHLVAISGLHVGLVALFSYRLTAWLLCLCPPLLRFCSSARLACFASAMAVWFYTGLSGASLPTLRAAIMMSVLLASQWIRWPLASLTRITLALAGVELLLPYSVLSSGFWLSFGAVFLLWLAMGLPLRPPRGWQGAIKAQLLISLGMAPLLALLFHQIALITPLTNLVAIPWVSFLVMPLVLLAVLLAGFSVQTSCWLFWLAHESLACLWWILSYFVHEMGVMWHPPALSWVTFAICALGVVLIVMPRGWPAKPLSIFMLTPLLFGSSPQLNAGAFNVTVLDVGQGLSVAVHTQHHWLVYDTGPRYGTGMDTGKAVVVPYLNHGGANQVHKLVVSHGDNDHIGGTASLLKAFNARSILTSVSGKPVFKGHASRCKAGQHWQWDGVSFSVIAPFNHRLKGNNASCVLKIGKGRHSVLLTGDIERPAEASVVKHNTDERLRSDILIAPHHGSKTSSTPRFVKAVSPRWVVYSTGFYNRFHFPSSRVKRRYKKQKAASFNTAYEGAITMVWNGHHWHINRYRLTHPHVWRQIPKH